MSYSIASAFPPMSGGFPFPQGFPFSPQTTSSPFSQPPFNNAMGCEAPPQIGGFCGMPKPPKTDCFTPMKRHHGGRHHGMHGMHRRHVGGHHGMGNYGMMGARDNCRGGNSMFASYGSTNQYANQYTNPIVASNYDATLGANAFASASASASASVVNGVPTYDYNYSTSPTTANASAFASATAGVPADPNLAAILAMLGNSGYSLTNATATSTPFDPNALAYADTTGGGLPSYLTEPGYSPASDPYLSQALASYQSQPS